MSDQLRPTRRVEHTCLLLIVLLSAVLSAVGITWGLPSLRNDKYLFGGAQAWSGETIYRLAGASGKFNASRGADVDIDPIDKSVSGVTLLTGSDEDVARILLRFRLYTYQPDEMITMMALAGMQPGKLDLDPRLYQYGGLFIYPVGGLIRLCGSLGLIDVRSDVPYYLDHPGEFGKFYVVARAYAAFWGLVGVATVFAIGRRLAGGVAGLVTALLFAFMPVVICMSHEGKPHLPGAVLMLLAVLTGMRFLQGHVAATSAVAATDQASVDRTVGRDWYFMCMCCGASFGMVLSSLPIFVLIPAVAWMKHRAHRSGREGEAGAHGMRPFASRTLGGIALAVAVYLLSNPYILINALFNRDVLASNFGNSLAMYDVSRLFQGFLRVCELTVEGASWPVAILGIIALPCCLRWRSRQCWVLVLPAAVFFLQFVLIGAGKPAEYGRFGIFPNAALAIGAGCLLGGANRAVPRLARWSVTALVITFVFLMGARYLWGFHADATGRGTRDRLAAQLSTVGAGRDANDVLVVTAEPAPYCFPPLNFSKVNVLLAHGIDSLAVLPFDWPSATLIRPMDLPPSDIDMHCGLREVVAAGPAPWWIPRPVTSPISWANKTFLRTTRVEKKAE